MLHLVENGDVAPSAARVAEFAGVGLRTVFRHFDDMDTLYREMTAVIETRVLPIIAPPLTGADWKTRILEVAERRAVVFETILPYRISANLKRFQSSYLMEDYKRLLKAEVDGIEALVPDSVKQDMAGLRSLNVILSFQTWRLLRHDQGLSDDDSRRVINRLLTDALRQFPDR
ncbi:TetR/AcrR family transcriptional regulator [Sphingorhabdus contaminans]|uniref:TetR/AcrR family transcriptional regulator n=2 Tax=Sphingorhabdus contaminans TaxID=1343899 RepID=A0A553WL46_9SPHN|nr:TetR/AcrR family transcriptional regulator [Sphingorhabdus contaminans]